MKNVLRCLRERFISIECFTRGGAYENPHHWQEKMNLSRIQYAKDNPWVLKYDFGHKELIEVYGNPPII